MSLGNKGTGGNRPEGTNELDAPAFARQTGRVPDQERKQAPYRERCAEESGATSGLGGGIEGVLEGGGEDNAGGAEWHLIHFESTPEAQGS